MNSMFMASLTLLTSSTAAATTAAALVSDDAGDVGGYFTVGASASGVEFANDAQPPSVEGSVREESAIASVAPNPTRGATTIECDVAPGSAIELSVLDVAAGKSRGWLRERIPLAGVASCGWGPRMAARPARACSSPAPKPRQVSRPPVRGGSLKVSRPGRLGAAPVHAETQDARGTSRTTRVRDPGS
jgi:hypothetical protein